jgi:hypothetical protein
MLKIREAKSVIREFPLIEIGVPNSVGNIYTEKSVDRIFEILENRKFFTGELVGSINLDGEYITEMEEYSHIIDHLFIEDNFIVAVIKFRSTKIGKEALDMFTEGAATFRPTIKGKIDEHTREIIISDIVGVDLLPVTDILLIRPDGIPWIKVK